MELTFVNWSPPRTQVNFKLLLRPEYISETGVSILDGKPNSIPSQRYITHSQSIDQPGLICHGKFHITFLYGKMDRLFQVVTKYKFELGGSVRKIRSFPPRKIPIHQNFSGGFSM